MTDRRTSTAMIHAAVDIFYRRMLADPGLSSRFAGVDLDRLKAHQRSFVTAALVGGDIYRGQPMRLAHQGLGIDDAEFDRAVGHLLSAMTQAGASEDTVARLRRQLEPLRADVVDR